MLDVDFDDTARPGLRRYVRRVTRALGMTGECSVVDRAGAYLAVDGRVEGFPDRDVALLWDEEGWSAAVETHSGGDLFVVARMGGEPMPPPHAVARWASTVVRDDQRPSSAVA